MNKIRTSRNSSFWTKAWYRVLHGNALLSSSTQSIFQICFFSVYFLIPWYWAKPKEGIRVRMPLLFSINPNYWHHTRPSFCEMHRHVNMICIHLLLPGLRSNFSWLAFRTEKLFWLVCAQHIQIHSNSHLLFSGTQEILSHFLKEVEVLFLPFDPLGLFFRLYEYNLKDHQEGRIAQSSLHLENQVLSRPHLCIKGPQFLTYRSQSK